MKKIIIALLLILPFSTFAKLFDGIAIKVNEKIMTFNDIEKFKDLLKLTSPSLSNQSNEKLMDFFKKSLVLEYYLEEKGIEISRKDVKREINKIAENMKFTGIKGVLKSLSEKMGYKVSEDDFYLFIKKKLVLQKVQQYVLFKELRKKITPPTEDEMLEFYQKYRSNFKMPAKIKIAHVVFKLPEGADFNKVMDVEDKINKVRKSISRTKKYTDREKLFFKYVKQYSPKIYQGNNGVLGVFDTEKLRNLFPNYLSALKLKKGQISKLIVFGSDNSRRLVFVMEKQGGESLAYEKAKKRISQILFLRKGQKKFEEWLSEYTNSFKISMYSKE